MLEVTDFLIIFFLAFLTNCLIRDWKRKLGVEGWWDGGGTMGIKTTWLSSAASRVSTSSFLLPSFLFLELLQQKIQLHTHTPWSCSLQAALLPLSLLFKLYCCLSSSWQAGCGTGRSRQHTHTHTLSGHVAVYGQCFCSLTHFQSISHYKVPSASAENRWASCHPIGPK